MMVARLEDRALRNLLKFAPLAIFALSFSALAPADTIWNVNATFAYNQLTNTASGSFTLNSSLDLVSWNITVAGTNTSADNTYTSVDSIDIFPDLTHLDFYDGSTNQYIDLYFASPLSNSGGTINLLYGDGGQSDNATIVCDGCGTLLAGTVSTATAVPEPSSIALLAMTGLAVILLRRCKKVSV